jgi:phosphopantetheine--protein transferase-like protein
VCRNAARFSLPESKGIFIRLWGCRFQRFTAPLRKWAVHGVDIVKVERFENISDAFLQRVFTDREREYITRAGRAAAVEDLSPQITQHLEDETSRETKKRAERASYTINTQSAAGIFAAKEAVAKALGTGFCGFFPRDIEILHKENGKPYVIFHKNPRRLKIHISISHTASDAIAFATIR